MLYVGWALIFPTAFTIMIIVVFIKENILIFSYFNWSSTTTFSSKSYSMPHKNNTMRRCNSKPITVTQQNIHFKIYLLYVCITMYVCTYVAAFHFIIRMMPYISKQLFFHCTIVYNTTFSCLSRSLKQAVKHL